MEYRFDGNVTAREEVSLDAGESTDFTASVNMSELTSDTYIHGVYTRRDEQPAQVRIVDEVDSFEVTGLTAPEPATVGDEVTVNTTVSNPNDFAIEQPVQFRFDGDLVESRTLDLDAESSTTVQFEVSTEGIPPGTYIHSVFTNDFGQDAIISIEAPDGESPTDGDDGDVVDDGEDADDSEDAGDGEDADDGEDGIDGEDSDEGQPETPEDG